MLDEEVGWYDFFVWATSWLVSYIVCSPHVFVF
jgi:hypothetical protein